jgi:biotin operon repressor
MSNQEEIVDFVKSLSDADRLRVVGLLSQSPSSQYEISSALGIPLAELTRHLEQLTASGVVRSQPQTGRYELDEVSVEKIRRTKLQRPRQVFSPPPHLSEEDSKIIRKLAAPDGSLKRLPGQLKQWMAVLRYILPVFTPATNYTEKQVNSLLVQFHADTAVLRRYLVDTGMLGRERDGSRYWLEVPHD